VKAAVGCFAPTLRKPPGHRPFLLVFGAVTGEPPSDLIQALTSSMRARLPGEGRGLATVAAWCAASSPGSWRRAMTR
jgi:hypothetical protein